MNKSNLLRVGCGIAFAIIAVTFPWPIFILVGVSLSFYFKDYWEFLIGAFIFDTVFGSGGKFAFGIEYATTLIAILAIFFVRPIKRRLWRRDSSIE